MNRREYAKLIIDVTTVATKAKLLVEQVKQTAVLRDREFAKANVKLQEVEQMLADMRTSTKGDKEVTASIHVYKSSLHKLAADLKVTVESPAASFRKQLDTLRKTFVEKIIANPGLQAEESAEFDLSHVHEQIEQTKIALATIDAALVEEITKLQQVQQKLSAQENMVVDLSLSHDVKIAADKAVQLEKKICSIETTLAREPGLRKAYAASFMPLLSAMSNLSLHQRALSAEPAPEVGNVDPVVGEANESGSPRLGM